MALRRSTTSTRLDGWRRELSGTHRGGYWYAAALRDSNLPATSRHVGHVLVSIADNDTGRIRVSLTRLADFTGLNRATIARKLNELERLGWVKRRRPEKWAAIKEGEMTEYTLVIPEGFPTSRPVRLGQSHSSAHVVAHGDTVPIRTKPAAPTLRAAQAAGERLGIEPHPFAAADDGDLWGCQTCGFIARHEIHAA